VPFLIYTNEYTLHESCISVELEPPGCAARSVSAGPGEFEVDLTDDALKVCNGRRIATIRMGSGGSVEKATPVTGPGKKK
jgi:hypothetical protein